MFAGFRVLAGACLGLSFVGVGCGGSAPTPSSADVVFPSWTESRPAAQPLASRKLEESENSSRAGVEADPNDAEHKERRERQRKASESTLLPNSANSKFFGGCGEMKGKCSKEPPRSTWPAGMSPRY